jgi:8-amino-7-oxononanoate synthase
VPAVLPSQYYLEKTDWLKQQGNWRTRVITDKVVSPLEADGNHLLIHREGQTLINFSGNDYLGLSQDNRLKQAAIEAIQNYGTGSGSARLISGHTELTHQLEKTIAGWKQTESALIFNSGYQTNVGILQAILKPGDWVFCDRLNHASLVDGCLLSGARWSRYRHLDLHHLDQLLGKAPQQVLKWIVTDSVFSMDGDYPDLKKLVEIAKKHHALIMLDEAHATGLFGNQRSSGLAEQFGVCNDIALQVGTFSKALGGSGGFVAGSSLLIEWLVNHARGFIYSTALPPSVIASALQERQSANWINASPLA